MRSTVRAESCASGDCISMYGLAPKQRAVLALLILSRGDRVSIDRLVDELWSQGAPATATKSVQVYVSGLRKALGDGMLTTSGRAYALELEPRALDAERFEQLAADGRQRVAAGNAAATPTSRSVVTASSSQS
jgi:DNA-binding SARP family transcriptional activator